jgi:hypothetical protein
MEQTLEQFRATRRFVPDLRTVDTDFPDMTAPIPGYLYLGEWYVTVEKGGKLMVFIGNDYEMFEPNDLAGAEQYLYERIDQALA